MSIPQFTITDDERNQSELTDQQVDDLCGDWQDPFPAPQWLATQEGYIVWDDSAISTKARWGDLLVTRLKAQGIEELVYVAPRVGWAGISLCALAKRHGLRLTLFMPAAKAASDHQLVAIERGARPIFVRIAAMPNLNKLAAAYAKERLDRAFVPFGLNHQLVTAAGVRSTRYWSRGRAPQTVISAVSTGVLTRTLQLAWPDAGFYGVAVARNIHRGEKGVAQVVSYHAPFSQPSRETAPFATELCYDMKAWEYRHQFPSGSLFWNVAGSVSPEFLSPENVDSQRGWGEDPR